MSLRDVTCNLSAKAKSVPGVTHSIGLKRGLRVALRYRRKHYTLSIARVGVYPSVAEKAILRRAFGIPAMRKWRTGKREQWHMWYIFWNPDNCEKAVVEGERRQLPIDWPVGMEA